MAKKSKAIYRKKACQSNSRTETFMALRCEIENWRWAGVPFYVRTGKRLPARVTEIVIHFQNHTTSGIQSKCA